MDVECIFCETKFKIKFEYDDSDLLRYCPSCGSDIKNYEIFDENGTDEDDDDEENG